MRPKVHFAVGRILTFTTLVGAVAVFILIDHRMLGPLSSAAHKYLSPMAAEILVQWVVPAAILVVPLLVHFAYWTGLPARCPRCGRYSSRRERGPWNTYACRSCGRRDSMGQPDPR